MSTAPSSTFSPFAPLLTRVAIGFYFFLLGLWSYLEPEVARLAVQKYAGFTIGISGIYQNVATYVFFLTGILLVAGLLTRSAALVGAIMILPLLYGSGVFSPAEDKLVYFLEKRSLYRDLVVFAGCLSLSLTGPGALSLEGIARGLYGK